jgi:flagellar export protein FliJ
MAKFVFSLEAVLTQRLAEEQRRQLAFAAIDRERLRLEAEIRGHQGTIAFERWEMSRQLSAELGPVDLRAARWQAHAALHATALAQQAVLKLAGLHRRLESARQELLIATTARKAVEKLREKQFAAWQDGLRRREAATLDELVVMRAARKDFDS